MRGDKVLRVFIWRLTEGGDVSDLEEFQKKSVFAGRPPGDNLAMLVRRFNSENPVGCELVTEAEMLAHLKRKKLGMTRQTLKTFRTKRSPEGFAPDGTRLWASDGNAIVYNREGMTSFVRWFRGKRRSIITKSYAK